MTAAEFDRTLWHAPLRRTAPLALLLLFGARALVAGARAAWRTGGWTDVAVDVAVAGIGALGAAVLLRTGARGRRPRVGPAAELTGAGADGPAA